MIQAIGEQVKINTKMLAIDQCILDTNAGKQLSYSATDVLLTLVLKKMNNI